MWLSQTCGRSLSDIETGLRHSEAIPPPGSKETAKHTRKTTADKHLACMLRSAY